MQSKTQLTDAYESPRQSDDSDDDEEMYRWASAAAAAATCHRASLLCLPLRRRDPGRGGGRACAAHGVVQWSLVHRGDAFVLESRRRCRSRAERRGRAASVGSAEGMSTSGEEAAWLSVGGVVFARSMGYIGCVEDVARRRPTSLYSCTRQPRLLPAQVLLHHTVHKCDKVLSAVCARVLPPVHVHAHVVESSCGRAQRV